MKYLRDLHDKYEPLFHKGGKLEKLFPLYEAQDTFLFTPGRVTRGASHVRDAIDLKRAMMVVVIALIPCIIVTLYNTGYQANAALAEGASALGWRGFVMDLLHFGYNAANPLACMLHGALYYLPVLLVTFVAGGLVEVLFGIVRRHEINEGFLVTGMLFPLVLPPTIPLWQVAMAIIFGVFFAKEVFGGTGMNIFNPALIARAFLFFAYPAQISGDQVWTAVTEANQVDGFSGATALGLLANIPSPSPLNAWHTAIDSLGITWTDAFLGKMPGSMGETSTLACLLGAAILILTGIGSWRIMLGGVLGSLAITLLFNSTHSETNALMNVPFYWHVVLGGWAFGLVFMATDPVSAPQTNRGRFIYGFFIGAIALLIRVANPAYPEGMMLAILFMNMYSPLLDWMEKRSNIKRREARHASV